MTNRHNSSSATPIHPDSLFHLVIVVCFVFIFSYLAARLGGTLVLRPEMIWPLWPGCAFLVAVLWLAPRKVWPAVLVAGLAGFAVYDVREALSIRTIGMLLVADSVEILIAALGISYVFGGVPRLNSIKSLAMYSFFAVILAPVSVASIAASAVKGESWWVAFFTEALALLTLTPAILSWVDITLTLRKKPKVHYLEAASMFVGLGTLAYFTFVASGSGSGPTLLYSLVPFLLWAALRFGIPGTTNSIVLVAFLAILGVVHGRGPFISDTPLNNVLSLQLFLLVAASSFMVLAIVVEQDKQAEHALRESAEALAGMSRKLIEAQEQERARIGRELHDDINQRLAMLAIELAQLQESSEAPLRIEELRKQIADISSDVQALSHDLHSSKLEYLGVVAGIKSWCGEFAERQKIEIQCRTETSRVVPLEVGLSLFRVLQEAVHNAIKHSGVKRIKVELWEDSSHIHLAISDFGKGFELEAALSGKGLGLTSMQERVRLVNGSITIKSKLMSGTTIHVRVPFQAEHLSGQKAV